MTAPAAPNAAGCRWNRLALPQSFETWQEHLPKTLQQCLWQSHPDAFETLLESPFGHLIVDWPQRPKTSLDWIQELRRRKPNTRLWLALDVLNSRHDLPILDELPTEAGLFLSLSLAELDCPASQRQLEYVSNWIGKRDRPLAINLLDCALLTPRQLFACTEFCRINGFEQLTLNDELARLTPLGITNLLSHLQEVCHPGLRLGFSTGNHRGTAVHNCLAAIAGGAQRIHGGLAAPTEQAQVNLSELLEHYQNSSGLQLERYQQKLTGQRTPQLPSLTEARAALSREAPEDCYRFIFRVSADDWHVQLLIEANGRMLDLGERVHHYVLLLLARAFCEHYHSLRSPEQSPDPLSLGWVERERLQQMIGDSDCQLNLKIFRAVKQVSSALLSTGLPALKPILTRVGSIRIASANFTIFKDSTLEQDVRRWRPLSPCTTARSTAQ